MINSGVKHSWIFLELEIISLTFTVNTKEIKYHEHGIFIFINCGKFLFAISEKI